MLFHPLYSLAFCKAWYVRCVSTIIRYLMQWLLSKPVINFQIMNCPLPVCFICHHDWLMGHRLSSNFFLMSTLRHLKKSTAEKLYSMNYSENWQKLGIYTTNLVSLTYSAWQDGGAHEIQDIFTLFWNIHHNYWAITVNYW